MTGLYGGVIVPVIFDFTGAYILAVKGIYKRRTLLSLGSCALRIPPLFWPTDDAGEMFQPFNGSVEKN